VSRRALACGFEEQLELAAARRARRRSWTRRPVAIGLIAAQLAATSAGAAVLITCGAVGGEPTRWYGADAPEANPDLPLHYGTRPVALGVAPRSGGRRFELVGYQLRSPNGSEICLDTNVLPDGNAYGCGNDREHAQGSVSGPDATLVDGATEPDIVSVEVRYRTPTASGRATAALVHVDGTVLKQLRLRDPFGFYVAELPGRVQAAVAEGYDASGLKRWEAQFLTL
jgi:hypothetical protein